MRARALIILALLGSPACQKTPDGDGKEVTSFYVDTAADGKALLYNLIGRWYPEAEIKRLSDRTLTPEQWCAREPTMVFLIPESVQIRCTKGPEMSAMIAIAQQTKDGKIAVTMRAKEDSPLKQLVFDVRGPKATISGNPCFDGKPITYGRFPEFEILSREILGGRRCAQFARAQQAE
jgi:hypothetical protein